MPLWHKLSFSNLKRSKPCISKIANLIIYRIDPNSQKVYIIYTSHRLRRGGASPVISVKKRTFWQRGVEKKKEKLTPKATNITTRKVTATQNPQRKKEAKKKKRQNMQGYNDLNKRLIKSKSPQG